MTARLGDLPAIQHGSRHLFGKRQADKRAAESNDEGPQEILMNNRSPEVDPEGGEHHFRQNREGDGQRDEDQNIGQQQ